MPLGALQDAASRLAPRLSGSSARAWTPASIRPLLLSRTRPHVERSSHLVPRRPASWGHPPRVRAKPARRAAARSAVHILSSGLARAPRTGQFLTSRPRPILTSVEASGGSAEFCSPGTNLPCYIEGREWTAGICRRVWCLVRTRFYVRRSIAMPLSCAVLADASPARFAWLRSSPSMILPMRDVRHVAETRVGGVRAAREKTGRGRRMMDAGESSRCSERFRTIWNSIVRLTLRS